MHLQHASCQPGSELAQQLAGAAAVAADGCVLHSKLAAAAAMLLLLLVVSKDWCVFLVWEGGVHRPSKLLKAYQH
jgi:hypothetical protein